MYNNGFYLSTLKFVSKDIVPEFHPNSGVKTQLSYGKKLYDIILKGRFDIEDFKNSWITGSDNVIMQCKLSELMKSIVKKPILPYVKTLTLEMVVNDHNDDVEVPYVRLVTSSKTINNIQITESSER
ncbi:hypothetical protein GLOIN_2v1774836 [Rhizophagus irregularis DAOM 181602=DAOM 197198]|uniref:Ubiquitin-activating enzyme E1 C-terminal domain-containing protein n=1 Tax=Rhizophagus irregularis (strain DAOM 181602 / DAOM 197198 / MUCL 43194) TaxID=747089 RepID=A0A2P4Q1B6_RHIID|nr:hypothetical protein GLOIN_2v1774836 [Rhizophagus irregularis DAOM 181602=DAOM 197198]POG71430.1 hypothetical protein GLOIN_2v1774836 [Rhizophagus irregularis DAOM 181602=DAOM 197198]|eukprot:XP_025178296.1 hypothetical protein GLOIN_2v1774836 [Rhizophagus irregularis DAOM 181602=DAOM 197198]